MPRGSVAHHNPWPGWNPRWFRWGHLEDDGGISGMITASNWHHVLQTSWFVLRSQLMFFLRLWYVCLSKNKGHFSIWRDLWVGRSGGFCLVSLCQPFIVSALIGQVYTICENSSVSQLQCMGATRGPTQDQKRPMAPPEDLEGLGRFPLHGEPPESLPSCRCPLDLSQTSWSCVVISGTFILVLVGEKYIPKL